MDKFKETRPLSSYLWTVNVGDFLVKEYNEFKIPMRLMTRRGNLYPCSTKLCFEACIKGVEFY